MEGFFGKDYWFEIYIVPCTHIFKYESLLIIHIWDLLLYQISYVSSIQYIYNLSCAQKVLIPLFISNIAV